MGASFIFGDQSDREKSMHRFSNLEDTLQSIDDTLKRIEIIMTRAVEILSVEQDD